VIAAAAAGIVAGYAVAIPVGAIALYLIGLTARSSLKIGLAAALGVASADGTCAALAVVAGAALDRLIEPHAPALRAIAAAVLVALAAMTVIRTLRARGDRPERTAPMPVRRAYGAMLGLTLLNPTTLVYFAALVIGGRSRLASGHLTSAAAQLAFVAGVFVASASWQCLLAGVGSGLGHLVSARRGQLVTAVVSAILIVILAVRLIWT
jgi:arginine exporter protein ArgO